MKKYTVSGFVKGVLKFEIITAESETAAIAAFNAKHPTAYGAGVSAK